MVMKSRFTIHVLPSFGLREGEIDSFLFLFSNMLCRRIYIYISG
ncbi:hypothetical protein ACJIZ3_023810 [Penstemon smallii]|uniref:Uncharacterized protein n=1 Tax=Penstemon smallii TaxID=265156 RepID=A0ABD3TQ29_9LAMI